jgi:hypothetical protein
MEDLRWKNKDNDKIGAGRLTDDSEKIKTKSDE